MIKIECVRCNGEGGYAKPYIYKSHIGPLFGFGCALPCPYCGDKGYLEVPFHEWLKIMLNRFLLRILPL